MTIRTFDLTHPTIEDEIRNIRDALEELIIITLGKTTRKGNVV